MSELDKALTAIQHREWEVLKSMWISHIPSFAIPGQAPANPPSDLVALSAVPSAIRADRARRLAQIAAEVDIETVKRIAAAAASHLSVAGVARQMRVFKRNKSGQVFADLKPHAEHVPGVREAVFSEALFLTHKAAHVLGAAEMSFTVGARTWSLADAYQSSLFAGKAIMSLCGVALLQVDGTTLLLDILPHGSKTNLKDQSAAYSAVAERIDHKGVWTVLQRVLRQTRCSLWPADAIKKLSLTDVQDFARQRNRIHYNNSAWILDDLNQFLTAGAFGTISNWGVGTGDIDFDRDDSSVVVAYYLLRTVLLLLTDLETQTGKITPELNVLRNSIAVTRHPFYYGTLI